MATSINTSDVSKNELTLLKNNRKFVRQTVTRKHNQLLENISELPLQNCKQLLGTFKGFQERLSSLNEKVGTTLLQFDENYDLEIEQLTGEEYEEKIYDGIYMLEQRITVLSSTEHNGVNNPNSQNAHSSRNKLKLPELNNFNN